MASVSYLHVYKRFGDVVVLTDLNMEIADIEFLVFVGHSGCGKSTNLRMLARLEEISEGEILIGDRVVNECSPQRSGHRHGVPKLCFVPPHVRLR